MKRTLFVCVLTALSFLSAGPSAGQAQAPAQQDDAAQALSPDELLADYRQRYSKTAMRAAGDKRKAINAQALENLRKQARGVINGGGLGKKKIKEELDPLVEKLEAALLPTMDDLAEIDERLADDRQAVLDAGIEEEQLKWAERVVALYILCESRAEREVIEKNILHRDDLSKAEADGIDLCNLRRLLVGHRPLKIDMKLVEASRDHSKDMVEHKFFSHTSPVEGKKTVSKRAKNFGTSASAENIAKGYSTGWWVVIKGWWNSPGHLKNMMRGGHRRVGLGQHKKHFTMMLGG